MLSKAIITVAIFFVAASATPSLAQRETRQTQTMSGTSEEEAACRRDTRRLCRSVKPDEGQGAFLACLQEHRKSLSKGCRAALESHGL